MSNQADADDAPEPPDLAQFVERSTLAEHPLFPLDEGVKETRDIRYVTFRRRRSDGRVDHCPEDIPASDIQSWADVIGPWGGGEYKAIGKDKHHKIIAWSPTEHGGWLLFDQPSKPFTLRDGRRYAREKPAAVEPSPAPTPAPTPPAAAPPAAFGLEALLVAMVNQSAETNRTILGAVLGQKPSEPSRHDMNPIEMMRAMREWVPTTAPGAGVPQTSIPEQLSTLRTLLELTRPQPAAPEASILGELGGLVTTVIQTDAAARASAKPSEPTERRPPPQARPPRRLVHVPGVGIVDVVQPEPEPPQAVAVAVPTLPDGKRSSEPGPAAASASGAAPTAAPAAPPVIDLETLRRDPAMVTALLRALGVSEPTAPSPPLEAPPAPPRSPVPSPSVAMPDLAACAPHSPQVNTPSRPAAENATDDSTSAVGALAAGADTANPIDVEDGPHEAEPLLSPAVLAGALRTLPGLSQDADAVAEGLVHLPPAALAMLTRIFQPDAAPAGAPGAMAKGS